MKGILLAGGAGTRLMPATAVVCKQLLPVYDKPMVLYPLTALMLAGIREILVISTPRDLPAFRSLLGDGGRWGVRFDYVEQPRPEGIAQALVLAEPFLDGAPVALALGDNLLFGHGLTPVLRRAGALTEGAVIFGYRVRDPRAYGVLVFDGDRVVDIVEKPAEPPSRFAVPGLYFYGPEAVAMAKALRPSARGELEITDLNRAFAGQGTLSVELLGRGIAWMDMGTPEALLDAAQLIASIETRQGLKVGCPEEVAFRMGWIDAEALRALAEPLGATGYGRYLRDLAEEGR